MAGVAHPAADDTVELPIETVQDHSADAPGWTDLEWEDPPASPRGFRRLFAGAFGRIVLPAVIAQSLLIGGGYATGREVVEFGARFGALGWIAVVTIFVGFSLMSILVYEFARVTKAYDYKSFVRGLIGPLWPLFDLVFAAMAVLVIAVMASAAGSIMKTTLGVPYGIGIGAIIAVVALLAFYGATIIEVFKTVGTALLYVGYLVFGLVVLLAGWPAVTAVFQNGDVTHGGGAGIGSVIGVGILYVGYNLVIYPAVLFTLHRQGSTRDSIVSGIFSGFTMTLPFLVTYLCVLAYYAEGDILSTAVPWLAMLEGASGPWLLGLFGLVVGWTLLETSIGLIHAMLDRIERGLPRKLLGWHKSAFAGAALLAAALLAQVGVISLVARGYTFMGYAFLALFAFPLMTVGVVRIVQAKMGGARRETPLVAVGPRPVEK